MSAWWMLFFAGLFEVGWAIGLKLSHGFSRPVPSVLTVAAMLASLWLLGLATRTLPIGTAYGVWVGIGATGAAVLGVVLLGEPITWARALFVVLLVVSIIGLKLTAP
jgi:quaternary ammonium compound-resistance protein SugE